MSLRSSCTSRITMRLTDLPNRVLLHDRMRQGILSSQRSHKSLAVMILELGGLESIIDAHGRYAGDRVIQDVASRLRALLREGDTVARLGANQFALMLPGTNSSGAELTARKVLQDVSRAVVLDGRPLSIEASLGIVSVPDHGTNPDELLQKAERALRAAQQMHSGSAIFSPTRDRDGTPRLLSIPELREGIEHAEFVFDYQPIVQLQSESRDRRRSTGAMEPSAPRAAAAQRVHRARREHVVDRAAHDAAARFARIAEWTKTERGVTWAPVAVNLSSKSLRESEPSRPDRRSAAPPWRAGGGVDARGGRRRVDARYAAGRGQPDAIASHGHRPCSRTISMRSTRPPTTCVVFRSTASRWDVPSWLRCPNRRRP
jgi:diguanylate cyclase (GGDEF)-like protein